jgi:aminopeptidase N
MRRILFAVLIAAPLAAQQPSNPNLERITNDVYTRSHDYDLVHQRIGVWNFDWDSTSFTGRVTTTLVARRAAMDSVVLDAGALLKVRAVTAPNGAALRFDRVRDTLVVHLARAAGFGDTVRFTVDYDGRVDNGRGLTFIDERLHTPRQIWSQGEDMDNHLWFPTYDFPNDKMTWDLVATVPQSYMVVSNGSLVSDSTGANRLRTLHWSQATPSATYLVSLVVAPLAKWHSTWRKVPVDAYVYPRDSMLAGPLFRVTPDMIDVYSRLTGIPYPWAKYAQTTVADFFGGMENVSATTLVDWLPEAKSYQDRPWYQYILIPHELAHQWFGDYVTTANWANTWLNEGFAEFMPGQYWAQKLGVKAEQDYYADEYRQFMGIERQQPMPIASLGSNNIYPKGALVLEMLKAYLGDQRFWAGVHRYLADHAYGVATTDDLRQAFLNETGENLDWFFKQWIYSAGFPSFVVTQDYDAAARRLTLVVKQVQRDSLKADGTGLRYVIPEAFTMPVDVRVGTTGGDVTRHAWIRQREDTIVVDNVSSAPTYVVFDDGNHILKNLTFEQATASLAAQLDHDANLWNREWVIGQLAKRTTDAAAMAAVARAATSADYYLTRQLAVAALRTAPPDVAIPSITTALRDTSAQVRNAAAAALGFVKDSRSLELARTAWRDPSYTVRASALSSMILLDTAGRAALVREGLKTPSYHDAIQNAALLWILRGDSTLFDDLEGVVGDQQLPTQILRSLASRGSAKALDLLVANLNDSRSWVRSWTVSSLRSLPPAIRTSALQKAEPTLRYADTRAQVRKILGL